MIQFDNVSCSYDRTHMVLDHLSFTIEDGEQVGLIGSNGAGKSTMMKALLGLIPFQGTIRVDELTVCPANIVQIRKKIGYVLQDSDNQMFMPTVFEDMIFGPLNYGMSRKDAEALVEKTLSDMDMLFLKNRQNYKMSGGEKRMAAIATILAMQPEVMLMDEPSTALDPQNRRKLIQTLNSLPVTKLIATHDLDMVLETCDRVILLGDGHVKADGAANLILEDQQLLESNHLELPFCLAGPKYRKDTQN